VKTLSREPWRGGQICGYQTNVGGWSEGEPEYCGELKKLNSPLCPEHDEEMREEHGGRLPKFAPGNALGLEITFCSASWLLRDADGMMIDAAQTRRELSERHGFTLSWEPMDDGEPVPATEEEVKAWENSGA
jgi:hypothetical protein